MCLSIHTNYGQRFTFYSLNFVSDGKFILELARTREGERVSWVSVPRKTFWPPQGTAASTPSYRQESSTSLSGKDLVINKKKCDINGQLCTLKKNKSFFSQEFYKDYVLT